MLKLRPMDACNRQDTNMHAACMYSCVHDLRIHCNKHVVLRKKIVTLNPYLPSPLRQGGHCEDI